MQTAAISEVTWRHSIYCGLLSRALARRCRVLHPERLFVLGLLHDLGSLVIYRRAPQLAVELLEQAQGNEEALYYLELEQLGFSHADVGGLLFGIGRCPKRCNRQCNTITTQQGRPTWRWKRTSYILAIS